MSTATPFPEFHIDTEHFKGWIDSQEALDKLLQQHPHILHTAWARDAGSVRFIDIGGTDPLKASNPTLYDFLCIKMPNRLQVNREVDLGKYTITAVKHYQDPDTLFIVDVIPGWPLPAPGEWTNEVDGIIAALVAMRVRRVQVNMVKDKEQLYVTTGWINISKLYTANFTTHGTGS